MAKKKRKLKPHHQVVNDYRARMRKAGLRLMQIWVPDTSAPGFREECRRQSALVSADVEHENEVLDWIEAATVDLLEDEPE